MKNKVLLGALAVSLMFNLLSLFKGTGELRDESESTEVVLDPEVEKVFYKSSQKGSSIFVKFNTEMSPEKVPVELHPRLKFESKWHSKKELELILKENAIPGKKYFVRAITDTKDTKGRELKSTFKEVFSQPLKVEEATLFNKMGMTEIRLVFNGKISLKNLEKYIAVSGPKGEKFSLNIRQHGNYRFTIELPLLKVDKVTLKIQIDLKADQAEKSLGSDFKKELVLDKSLKLVSVYPRRNSRQVFFELSFNRLVEIDAVESNLKIEPPVNVEMSHSYNDEIYLKGDFKPATTYKLTLKKGLKAKDNSRLPEDVIKEVMTDKLQPSIEFLSKGPFYPAGRDFKIPVKVVGLSSFNVKVTKVFPNNIVRFFDSGYYSKTKVGKNIVDKKIETGLSAAQKKKIYLDLTDSFSEKGIYIISINNGSYWNSKNLTVIRSDLGLSMASTDTKLQVWAFDLNTGLPLKDVSVSLISLQNQNIAEEKSDEQGITEFNLKSLADKPLLIRLEKGGDISYRNFGNAINLSAFNMKGRPFSDNTYETFMFSERDVCRPGETIDLSMIIRDRNKKAAGGFPLELRLFGPSHDKEFANIVQIPESGFLSQKIKFNKGSRTGYYRFQLGIPGDENSILSEKEFLVNSFTADTFKVAVEKPEKIYTGTKIPVSVSANYNFGGSLNKSKVILDADYSEAPFSNSKFKGYYFGDATRKVFKNYFTKGQLDENGKGTFSIDLVHTKVGEVQTSQLKSNENLPSALAKLSVNVSVTDSAGETVSRRQVYSHMPYPYLIGATKEKSSKEETEIKWVRVDSSMEKIASNDRIQWQLFSRKWHYSYKSNSRGSYVWDWRSERTFIKKGEIVESAQEGILSLGDLRDGLYEVSLESQNGFIRTVYEFDVSQSGNDLRLGNSEFVKLYSDKSFYKPGEMARLRFESPADGVAVLRLSDNELHSQLVKPVQKGWNTINFKVPESSEGNFYAALTLVRKLDQKLSLPPRFFGLLNMDLDNEDKRLEVSLKAPGKVEPGELVKVSVSVKGKQPFCKVKLMAVDEGVLALTGFKTPNPFESFFAQKELKTKFMDVFDEMFPELNEVFGKVSLAGGGGGLAFKGGSVDLVKSHAISLGIHETDENGKLSLEFKAPQFNGAVRIMAVAVNEASMGHAEINLIVKDKVSIIAGKVKALSSGDVLTLPVSLFNNEEQKIAGELTASVDGPLEIISQSKSQVSIEAGKLTQLHIRVKAQKKLGAASIKLSFKSAEIKSEKIIKLIVRPAYARVSVGQNGQVQKGTKRSLNLAGAFYEGTEQSTLMVSTSSASEMYTYFRQLQDYPYGCLEQTSSRAVVNLLGSQLAPEMDQQKSLSIVKAALDRIRTMQTHNGGFSMWPRGDSSWTSASVYAGHFMAECKSYGIQIDSYVVRYLVDYLQRLSENQFDSSVVDQAYALYVLALLGKGNNQKAESILGTSKNPVLAKVLACGALSRAGKNDQAAKAFKVLDLASIRKEKINWDMDSPARRLGLSSLVAIDIFGIGVHSQSLCESLLELVRTSEWQSTQDKALVCLVAGKRAIMMNESPDSKAMVSFNGQKHEVTAKSPLLFNGKVDSPIIENSETGPVYFSYYSSGIPLNGGQEVSEGMNVERFYLDKDGKELKSFKVGDLVQVNIKIKAGVKVDNTVILDLLPGCMAVESAYLKSRNGSFKVKNGKIKYYEGLDDRMIICTDLLPGVESEFTYTARVIAGGRFNTCGISAEGMYLPQVRASVNSLDLLEVANEP